ncbi:MAG: hypothetical protein K2Y32_05735 [Candidatus Obscuribacterales bacterium]|nr:hypothetical protein [Candidatus Obscuribacterales bacterium]
MSLVDQLASCASVGAMSCERFRSLWHHVEVGHLESELLTLAYQAVSDLPPRQALTMPQLLEVFFEPPVAKLLMQLPNSYWFHSAIAQSAISSSISGHCLERERTNRIGLPAYQLAIEALRLQVLRRFDLSLGLDRLSPVQVAARNIHGIIVLRMKGSGRDADGELLVNPIFEPIFKID